MSNQITVLEAEIEMMRKRKEYNLTNFQLQNARLDEQVAEAEARLALLQGE